MKTNLFLLGMAVAALSSCTNEEVTDVAQNRAIKFNQFVENNTRVVQEVESLSSYYLFGALKDISGSFPGTNNVFNNEPSSVTQYWSASKSYSFGAYADGEGGKNENVTFDAELKKLTFANYTVNDAKDLVAATAEHTTDADVSNESNVELTFKHMLSQVKFTFTTTDADAYTLAITDLKFSAAQTATGSYTNDGIVWSGFSSPVSYDYEKIDDVADATKNYTASSNSKLVIPQDNKNLKVTFTASIEGPGMSKKSASFEGELAYKKSSEESDKTEDNKWTAGYKYKYTAEINAKKIAEGGDDEVYPIVFKITVIEDWKDATDQSVEPKPVVP